MGTSLEHVFVVGGTSLQWSALGDDAWTRLADRLGHVVADAGASWLTFRPYAAGPDGGAALGVERRVIAVDGDRCTVIIDPTTDGRVAFAAAAAAIPAGETVDEKAIARNLYAPADAEPDLIVVLGPDDRLPPSLVWELAYGELVFVHDRTLAELGEADLDRAIGEYNRRHRRFGGLEA